MAFSHIRGQATPILTLTRALEADRVHHAYRFEGPDGVGKEMVAFALAQALVCVGGDRLGCGKCDACRRAVTLSEQEPHTPLHPDVRLLERGLYAPDIIGLKSGTEKQGISVDQVRTLVLTTAAFPPHEGRARVFIIRRADELGVSAANALLKTLEEPGKNIHFILLTSRPNQLLSTIRSRTLPLRFAPLSDAIVDDILAARGVPEQRRALAIELAGGSASAAIELCDEELSASRDAFVQAMDDAVAARSLGPALSLASGQTRETLAALLPALAAHQARIARRVVTDSPCEAARAARRYEAIVKAQRSLGANPAPALLVSTLVAAMQRA